jgi:hypothetical protein
MTDNDLIVPGAATPLTGFLNHNLSVSVLAGMATLGFALCLGLLSIFSLSPPSVIPNVPLTEFSSARARNYLTSIAQKPHPIGSVAHAEVRDYILKELAQVGSQPQVQKTNAVNTFWGWPYRAGTVENIVARLPGTASTRAVLLVGHYDAAPSSLGASDDGAAIATLLETLRALKASAPLKNDVIFLATDGEEVGLLGAIAFTQQHPWAKDVGVVLNLEARGDHGPSIMFQTSDGNGWLIEEFAKSVNHPVATSLSGDIYKLLPNDTDFTVFRNAGMNGLNFAYIEGTSSYHSQLDSMANLDDRSLQHHGMQSLALARHLGNLDLSGPLKTSDAVYFDLFGRILIHYSRSAALVLAGLVTLITLGTIVLGLRRKRLTVLGPVWGFLALLLSMISASLLLMLVWWLIVHLRHPPATLVRGDSWANHLYLLAFVFLTAAATAVVYSLSRKRVSVDNLAAGTLLWFFLLMVLSVIYFPGGSYLLMWPLLFVSLGLILKFSLPSGKFSAVKLCLVFTLCAVPGVILISPVIYHVFVAVGLNWTSVLVVPVSLLLGLFVVNFDLIGTKTRWLLPVITAAVAICFFVVAVFQPDFNQRQPKRDELFYALNADTGKAVWASGDAQPDEWTSQFLSGETQSTAMSEYFPWLETDLLLQRQAPDASLPEPEVKVLQDQVQDQARSVHLRVSSPREAATLYIYVKNELSEKFVNQQSLGNGQTAE